VIRPTPAFLWRARHFVALRLPTGAWLARRDDLAYLDTLMRRWAPRWSGAARDQTLTEAKAIFANAALLDAALEYYREFRPRERAGRVAQPGLVIGGTTDIFPVESFGRCPEEFDAPCDVVVVDGAGHWPHRESPGPVHERLLAFLATLR
jgi:pimeloyl-ACP methyl ester carboxylesterase